MAIRTNMRTPAPKAYKSPPAARPVKETGIYNMAPASARVPVKATRDLNAGRVMGNVPPASPNMGDVTKMGNAHKATVKYMQDAILGINPNPLKWNMGDVTKLDIAYLAAVKKKQDEILNYDPYAGTRGNAAMQGVKVKR